MAMTSTLLVIHPCVEMTSGLVLRRFHRMHRLRGHVLWPQVHWLDAVLIAV
jgi:hypothetical protein